MPDQSSASASAGDVAATPTAYPRPAIVVVRAAIAPMHTEPRVSSAQVAQALAGQLLLVHEEAGEWLRAAGLDGYAAWLHRGYLAGPPMRADAGGTVEAEVGPATAPWAAAGTRALLRAVNREATQLSLGCVARSHRGARPLPLGALLEGEVVESGAAVRIADQATRFPREAAAIAASAPALFAGTSYQWGGVTPWGADCSGFVQSLYRLHGVELPRDAWQQALAGAPAPARVADLAPADLLFFSDRDDRRITHVAVALGGSRVAHVALGRGGFAVERLDDARDEYVARLVRQRVGARRVV